MKNIIVRPIISEKSMALAESGKFSFQIFLHVDKPTLKRAVEKMYGVTVKKVQTTVVKGKRQRVGKRRAEVDGQIIKKAVVTLAKGQKISLFDLGGEK